MFLQAGHGSTPTQHKTVVHVLNTPILEVSLQAVCLGVLIMEDYGNYLILDTFLNTRHEFGTEEE